MDLQLTMVNNSSKILLTDILNDDEAHTVDNSFHVAHTVTK